MIYVLRECYAFIWKGLLSLLENSDNDMAMNLIAIKKLRLSDVWDPSQASIKVALIVVFR